MEENKSGCFLGRSNISHIEWMEEEIEKEEVLGVLWKPGLCRVVMEALRMNV